MKNKSGLLDDLNLKSKWKRKRKQKWKKKFKLTKTSANGSGRNVQYKSKNERARTNPKTETYANSSGRNVQYKSENERARTNPSNNNKKRSPTSPKFESDATTCKAQQSYPIDTDNNTKITSQSSAGLESCRAQQTLHIDTFAIDNILCNNNDDIDFDHLINEKLRNASKKNETKMIINERGFEEPEEYKPYSMDDLLDTKNDDNDDYHSSDDENEIMEKHSKFMDYQLTPTEKEMLNNLEVNINFKISELHTYGCRWKINRPDYAKIKKSGIKVQLGRYLKVEDDTIKANFKEFCERHNIPNNGIPFIIMRAKHFIQRSQYCKMGNAFAQYIARGLNRPLHCVYAKFRILFGEYKIGSFSEYENRIITEYFQKYKDQASEHVGELTGLINRPYRAIYNHFYLTLRLKKNGYRGGYGKSFDQIVLIREVMKEANVTDVNQLKDINCSNAFFKPISERLNIIPFTLFRLWNRDIYIKLFSTERNISRIVKKVLDMMIADEIDDIIKVDYIKYTKEIEGSTTYFIGFIVRKINTHLAGLHWINNVLDKLKYVERWIIRPGFTHIPTIDLTNL